MLEDILRKPRALYFALPAWQKAIVGSLYHMIPQRLRLGGSYVRFKKLLKTSQYWSKQQCEDYQYVEMLNTLTQAYEHVPYYKKTFSEYGLSPADFTCLGDIKKFPMLSKKDIQENYNDLIADNVPAWRHLITTTGGSTIEPLSFLQEKGVTRSKERAFIWDGCARVGYYPRARTVQLEGRSVGKPEQNIFWEYEPIQGYLEMNSNYLTESYIPLYLDKIRDFKPEFLIGYVSSINQLAQFLKNNPRRDFPKLKAVCLSSENVFPWQRELMAKVFGCRIFSFYGHSEMVLLGMECEESHNLHFYPQYGYLEVMNTNGDILDRPGAMGELVGTSFHNRVMPLIRYRTQDYGTIGEPDCKCGRHHPIISDVEGRLQEFIVTADHRLISICVMGAAHFNISKYVYETQYYQDRPGHVVFRVVPRADYGEEQKAIILKTLKTKLGNDVAVEIEEVERLKKSRSGKHIMIEQNLSVPTYWETYAITYDQSVITSQPTTLIQDSMVPAQNAVEWHTQIAGNFDLRYSKSKNFIERYAVWTRMIDKYCSPDMSVLDVGCGSGIFSFYLAERTTSVTGIDASTEMLNICQEKKKQAGLNNVDFLECDIKYLRELLDEKVDLIICSSVLEYLDDLDASLKSLFSLMKNNGVLMISMPNKQSLYRMAEPIAYKIIGRPGYYKHVKHVCTLEEIESKLKACGLDILEKQFYEQTPFLSKMLRKIGLSAYADQMFIVVAKMDCKKSMLG